MKTSILVLASVSVLFGGLLTLNAADNARRGGPKGGRLLESTAPIAEFCLESNHAATVTFYDAALQRVPASGQTVTVIADANGEKQTIEFEAKDGALASKTTLPAGDGYNLVVQVRQTADAKPQNFRFKLATHICEGCKLQEYACTCDE